MNGLRIEKRLYAEKWPVWAILMDGIVYQVCLDEPTAERRVGEILKDMEKAKAGRPAINQCNDVTDLPTPPTFAEIGITKRQSSDWQKVADNLIVPAAKPRSQNNG